MRKPTTGSSTKPEINVTLVNKSHVTMLMAMFVIITFISLYAQWQNQQRIENAAIQRCFQRMKLEALVTHETAQVAAIDSKYFSLTSPGWVAEMRDSLTRYAADRKRLGDEQCNAPR